ncbi:DNA replication and repair protein RecF [Candidatus Microgenomates bacterium]|nr:MAG: DNA replication and repair protein RecF [Candidatus Microgenomates bacterium]
MKLTKLSLGNFRSYIKRDFVFNKNLTVIVGPNAIGKTNILEAIFLLSTGKSFRASLDREMIAWDFEVGRVRGEIASQEDAALDSSTPLRSARNDKVVLEVVITTGMVQGQKAPVKKYLVNGVARRQADFAARLKTVLFEPEDLDLVRGSPSLRRKYLDAVLIQVDREYRRSLFSYEKGLRQRNRLLFRIREEGVSRNQLTFWDQLLIKNGSYITAKREELIVALNAHDKPFGDFTISYDASFISEKRLLQYSQEEVAAAVTLVGPHRDDIIFYENKRNMAAYGSRGEQRLVVLWLKISELTYVEEETQERPLLLLDDIFSELDHTHRAEVLNIVDKQQTIITTTDIHFIPENVRTEAEMVELT